MRMQTVVRPVVISAFSILFPQIRQIPAARIGRIPPSPYLLRFVSEFLPFFRIIPSEVILLNKL
jgi:hypothetical protein